MFSRMKAEIRKDYFLPRYVIITHQRKKRPRSTVAQTIYLKKGKCPFCWKNIEKDLLVKTYKLKSDKIVVIENKYPVVSLDNPKAYGKHEIIIETLDHKKDLSEVSQKHLASLFSVWQDRTEKISKIKGIEYILIFKNEGGKAGASIVHSHMQIFSSNIIPPDVWEESYLAHKIMEEKGYCPYCQIIKKEEKSKRLIYKDKFVVCFAPYASAFHYEAWIFPRRHIDNVCLLKQKEIFSMAKALKIVLKKLFNLGLSYNFYLHQLIKDPDQHFYIKVQPREAVWGGIELGSGIVVNSMPPEKAAEYYRS